MLSSNQIPLRQDRAPLLSLLSHPSTGSFTPQPRAALEGGHKGSQQCGMVE